VGNKDLGCEKQTENRDRYRESPLKPKPVKNTSVKNESWHEKSILKLQSKQYFNQNTEVTALPPSFDYWNEN
jgi:hypothetical protein